MAPIMNTKDQITRAIKRLIMRFPNSHRLRVLAYLPLLRQWERKWSGSGRWFPLKGEMHAFVAHEIGKQNPIDYLEFGVWYGQSMEMWNSLNDCPNSRFVGFDTFTGLPDRWLGFTGTAPQHHFTAQGQIPPIDDSRVNFVQGLFQDTLPEFLETFRPVGRVVIHIDVDIYSSALYVLSQCDQIMQSGSIVIFDEFNSVMDEFRALQDYCQAYRRSYRVLGSSGSYDQLAIEIGPRDSCSDLSGLI